MCGYPVPYVQWHVPYALPLLLSFPNSKVVYLSPSSKLAQLSHCVECVCVCRHVLVQILGLYTTRVNLGISIYTGVYYYVRLFVCIEILDYVAIRV